MLVRLEDERHVERRWLPELLAGADFERRIGREFRGFDGRGADVAEPRLPVDGRRAPDGHLAA